MKIFIDKLMGWRYDAAMSQKQNIFFVAFLLLVGAGLSRSFCFAEEPASLDEKPVLAQNRSEIPKPILDGLYAYKFEGAEAAIKAWVANGPMEADSAALAGGADTFKNVQSRYGAYLGHQVLSSVPLSDTSKYVFVQMNYEKGPLFLRFLCYWTGTAWVVTGRLVINTDPQAVLIIENNVNQRSVVQ